MGGPIEETSGKEESQEGTSGRTEARGGTSFPQVSVKGYRGVEKRGLVILPPFYMESRLIFFFFFFWLKYSFQAG